MVRSTVTTPRAFSRAGPLAACLLAVLGCTDVEEHAPRAAVLPAPAAPDVEEVAAKPIAAAYDPVGRRDPFGSFVDDDRVPEELQAPLQRFDLARLRLVGVVVGTASPSALIEDPSGVGHTIRVGTALGKNLGRVKHIRRGEVIVAESYRDATLRRIDTLTSLRISQ
jgi:type IV pilus assembly protein PilP